MTPEPRTTRTTRTTHHIDAEATQFYTAPRCSACRCYHGTRPCTTS